MAKNADKQLNCAEPWEGTATVFPKPFVQPREEGLLECCTLKVLLRYFRALTSFLSFAQQVALSWCETQASHTGVSEAAIQRALEREASTM